MVKGCESVMDSVWEKPL